jgi:hypothetical protein
LFQKTALFLTLDRCIFFRCINYAPQINEKSRLESD